MFYIHGLVRIHGGFAAPNMRNSVNDQNKRCSQPWKMGGDPKGMVFLLHH